MGEFNKGRDGYLREVYTYWIQSDRNRYGVALNPTTHEIIVLSSTGVFDSIFKLEFNEYLDVIKCTEDDVKEGEREREPIDKMVQLCGDIPRSRWNSILIDSEGNLLISLFRAVNRKGEWYNTLGTKIERSDVTLPDEFMLEGACLDSNDNIISPNACANKIGIFDHTGTLMSSFGSKGKADGKLKDPIAVAFDKYRNRILIIEEKNDLRVQVFTTTGEFVLAIKERVIDPFGAAATSSLYVIGMKYREEYGFYSPEGQLLSLFKHNTPDANNILAYDYKDGINVIFTDNNSIHRNFIRKVEWTPKNHLKFPKKSRRTALTILIIWNRGRYENEDKENVLTTLPLELIHYLIKKILF